jgi:hypothetical protein
LANDSGQAQFVHHEGHEGHEGFGQILSELRVLRDLRGENAWLVIGETFFAILFAGPMPTPIGA